MRKQDFAEWIVITSYLLIPILAFSYKFFVTTVITKWLYDLIILFLFFPFIASFIQSDKKNITKTAAPFLTACFLMGLILFLSFFLKVIDTSYLDPFYLFPFLLELKLPFYLLLIGLAYKVLPPLQTSYFVISARIFSIILILDVFIRFLIYGELTRPAVVSESNYDGVLILVGVVALFTGERTKEFSRDYILFFIAIGLTLSRTCMATFIMLSFFHFLRPSHIRVRYLFFLLVSSLAGLFLLTYRLSGIEDFSTIDRIVMWISFIDLINTSSWQNLILGYFPGFPLKETDAALQWFITNQSEEVGAEGLHAFNYHSFWLRITATYGLVFTSIVLAYFIKFSFKGRPYFYFSLLIFLQGLTMGTFYLSVNILILSMYFLTLLSRKDFQRTKRPSRFNSELDYELTR